MSGKGYFIATVAVMTGVFYGMMGGYVLHDLASTRNLFMDLGVYVVALGATGLAAWLLTMMLTDDRQNSA